MTIKLNEKNYEIVKNYKDGFNEEELINKLAKNNVFMVKKFISFKAN